MKRLLAGLVLLLAFCACCVCADTPSDVPSDHWAYEAVRKLIDDGYMIGYPDGSFVGNRTLTRYEFAVVISRVIDGMAERAVKQTSQDVPRTTTSNEPTKQVVTPEDMVRLQKLIDEFKPELAVIGAKLEKLEAAVDGMKSDVDNIKTILEDEEGPLQSTRADVSKLKKVGVSGYVQARYNIFRNAFDEPTKGKEPTDNFSVRRARIKVAARPTDRSSVVIQWDGGQGSTGTPGPAVSVKDAYVQYDFACDQALGLSMAMGQMKWPFGYEIPQSSSVRETPERALILQRLFPGERDRGFLLSYPINRQWNVKYMICDGNETKWGDPNNAKDSVGTLRFDHGDLCGGISGYYGRGIVDDVGGLYLKNKNAKTRYGADIQYYMNRLSFKAEYVSGKGVDGSPAAVLNLPDIFETVSGGWAQVAFNITPVDTFVANWETMSSDPKNKTVYQYGRRSAWNLGLIRQLDSKTRIKGFYQINEEEKGEFENNNFILEWITTF